jgi:hypothetical protein
MSQIFEVFGYRLDDDSPEAKFHRSNAWCPFMNNLCDGGGNRWSTQINLTTDDHEELRRYFPHFTKVMPGVCSIQVENNQSPWIVCSRRLLVLGREKAGTRQHQRQVEAKILEYLHYESSTKLGVWSEVNLMYRDELEGTPITFDYAFDYVLVPVQTISIRELMDSVFGMEITPLTTKTFTKTLLRHGFQIENDEVFDFPTGRPSIIEIMTSSTSGSNKSNRSQISQAFEDALLRGTHTAPGINYRQVWSRMVGQLFVKSEVASAWGGATVWVLQDRLVKYMDATTRVNMSKFVRDTVDEVNIVSFSYPLDYDGSQNGINELNNSVLYAGKILETSTEDTSGFIDIVRAAILPPVTALLNNLVVYGPAANYVVAP